MEAGTKAGPGKVEAAGKSGRILAALAALAALAGLVAMPTLYFSIMLVFNSFDLAVAQFRQMLPFVLVISALPAFQFWIYSYASGLVAVGASPLAGSAGVSGASMVARCAHHLTDVPLIGISTLTSFFFFRYQPAFLLATIFSNVLGTFMMLSYVRRAGVRVTGIGFLDFLLGRDLEYAKRVVLTISFISVVFAIGYVARYGG